MNEFDILQSAAAGMDAQRAALDVAARNVAAAEATPGAGVFERMVPRFALADDDDSGEPGSDLDDAPGLPVRFLGAVPERGVDVDAMTEMVAVLDAQRAYETDASVFDAGKRLAERTIDMGRLQ